MKSKADMSCAIKVLDLLFLPEYFGVSLFQYQRRFIILGELNFDN